MTFCDMFVHCVSEAPLQVTGVRCSTLTVSRTTYLTTGR